MMGGEVETQEPERRIWSVLDSASDALINLQGVKGMLTHLTSSEHQVDPHELEMLSNVMHDAVDEVTTAIKEAMTLAHAARKAATS